MSKRPVGFDFSKHMRLICEDMTSRVAALQHIQMDRVGVGFCQTRSGSVDYGVFASLTPLRCFRPPDCPVFRKSVSGTKDPG